jgi:hypothetical protein
VHRPLGAIERYIWSGEQRTPLNGTIVADVEGSLDRRALAKALLAVQRRHPLLRVAVEAVTPRRILSSRGVGPIPLAVVNSEADDAWQHAACEQLRQPYVSGSEPLVRCTVVTRADGFHLVLGGSHLIADALSALSLVTEVLLLLGSPDRPLELLPELPPLEALVPPAIAAELSRHPPPPPALAPLSVVAEHAPLPAASTSGTQITCWQLPALQVTALLARCRHEQVTVQNAICALLVRALITLDGNPTQPRRLQAPVNIRDRLAMDVTGHYGMFITLVGIELANGTAQSAWELARQGQQLLTAQLQDAPIFTTLLQIKAASDQLDDQQFLAVFGGRGQAPWDLSVNNLGRLAVPENFGPLRVRKFWGPLLNVGGFETVFGIHSFAGRMSFAISSGAAARAAMLRDAFLLELQLQLNHSRAAT